MKPDRDPHAHTMTLDHTDGQIAIATARAALRAWARAECRPDSAARLRAFTEAVHAHDFVAQFGFDAAQTWRRRLAAAIELARSPTYLRAANEARAHAARLNGDTVEDDSDGLTTAARKMWM